MPTRILRALCLAFVAAAGAVAQAPIAPQPAQLAPEAEITLAPGVTYRHLLRSSPAGEPWSIHVLELNRQEKKIVLQAVRARLSDNGMQRELPTVMASRPAAEDVRVLAVVNGDFDLPEPHFGVPTGLSIYNGQLSNTGNPGWPAFAILKGGQPQIALPGVSIELNAGKKRWPIADLNKPFGVGSPRGSRVFTREFRPDLKDSAPLRVAVIGRLSPPLPLRADGDVRGTILEILPPATEFPIPPDALLLAERLPAPGSQQSAPGPPVVENLRPGQNVTLRLQTRMAGKKGVRDTIGGLPILLHNGQRAIAPPSSPNLQRRHPRTAACYNDRQIIFAVVDGRQPQLSVGMTLEELADFMVSLGCAEAMNTDGGGSSVMAISDPGLRIVNSPSDGRERGRGNAWLVIQR